MYFLRRRKEVYITQSSLPFLLSWYFANSLICANMCKHTQKVTRIRIPMWTVNQNSGPSNHPPGYIVHRSIMPFPYPYHELKHTTFQVTLLLLPLAALNRISSYRSQIGYISFPLSSVLFSFLSIASSLETLTSYNK